MTTRILGGKGNRTRRSQKASCRATTSRRPPTRYERSHTRKVNLCIIQVLLNESRALTGPLPAGLRELSDLQTVNIEKTELCAPGDTAFQTWLATITFRGLICPPAAQTVIDVAVFYTPAAREWAGGIDEIETSIDLMIAETNVAYEASGVHQRIKLVAVEEVAGYTQGVDTGLGESFTDLNRMKSPSDGYMDEVHGIRDTVAADIVLLVRSGFVNRAYLMGTPSRDFESRAFGVVIPDNALTFAHELGHIMGLRHDRYTVCGGNCNVTRFPYAFGYVNQRAFDPNDPESPNPDPTVPTTARWRTVMSYNNQCAAAGFGCQLQFRFSNPDQLHPDPGGDPLGKAGLEPAPGADGPSDAVRMLNRTRGYVANFRSPPDITVSFGAAQYTAAEGGAAATVTVRLSAAPTRSIDIPFAATGATGAAVEDYSVPRSVAFAADDTEQTFTVTAVDDDADDDGETVTLTLGYLLPGGVSAGSPATATVTLTDNDTVTGAPSILGVSLTSDPGGGYAAGEKIEVTVRFDQTVKVTGSPQLGLTVGSVTRQALYQGGAREVVIFSYEVADDETDGDGVSIAAGHIDRNGGTIRDGSNNDAVLQHDGLAADANHRVDGVKPMLLEAVVDETVLTLTFDEPLHQPSFRARRVFLITERPSQGGSGGPSEVVVRGSIMTVTLLKPVLAGQTVFLNFRNSSPFGEPPTIQDIAGNAAAPLRDREVTNVTEERVYDTDADRLIEITTLAQLNAVRHDLDGDGVPTHAGANTYRAAFPDAFPEADSQLRCVLQCRGYELKADLDFDTDDDGDVDSDDYYWNNGAGWNPIGNSTTEFQATFEGNGHTVRNLFIDRPTTYRVGLFGDTDSTSAIRNVGVTQVDVTGYLYVGGLVGQSHSTITTSYATGRVSGFVHVGGLVGQNFGIIKASYSTGRVSGTRVVGGLVGSTFGYIHIGNYATGRVSGEERIGGLVGLQNPGGPITASYATGRVTGTSDVGGLAGAIDPGRVFYSYWDTLTSGQATGSNGQGQTTAQLQAPTAATGIYADWDDDLWDFGLADEYPVLAVDFDGDGDATWQEFGYQLREGPALMAEAGATGATLTWTAVDTSVWMPAPSVSYTVYREEGTTVEAIAENLTELNYTDSDVTAGETYTYQVAAVVTGGEATRSAQVSVGVAVTPLTVTLELMPNSISENGGAATVTARLNRSSSEETTVTVSATAVAPAVTADFTLSANKTLTITSGQTGSTGTVTITANNNNVDTPNKTVRVSGTASNSQGVSGPAEALLTIRDDDAAPVLNLSVDPEEIEEAGGTATVKVEVTNRVTFAEDQTITLTLEGTADEGTDYTVGSETLTLTAGQSEVTTIVTAINDKVNDEAETILVTATHGSSPVGTPRTIRIRDDDAAPVITTAALIPVAENETVVATLQATDEDDRTEDLEWEITGGEDGSQFTLTAGGGLAFTAAKDYEEPDDSDRDGDYQVTVQVSDGFNAVEVEFTVRLQDVDDTDPTVSGIGISSNPGTDGTYAIGDEIEVTVTFDETVVVTGRPWLSLTVGAQTKPATYDRGSDSDTLVFAYPVASSDLDTDGVSITAGRIDRNGGTIKDGSENEAVLDHEAVAPQAGHKVDGVKPELLGAALDGASLTLTYGELLDGSSRPATGDFTVRVEGTERSVSNVAVNGSAVELTLDVGAEHGEAGIQVSYTPGANPIQDVPGNDAAALSREAVTNETPDTTSPTVSSVEIPSTPPDNRDTYAIGDVIEVTVTFSETVVVTRTPRMRLRVGSRNRTAGYLRGSGAAALVFSYEVALGDEDTDGVSIAAGRIDRNGGTIKDEADNDAVLDHEAVAPQAGHKVDGVRPEFLSAAVDGSSLTLTYGEALDGGSRPAPGDFTVEVGGTGRSVSAVSVSGRVVTLTLDPAVEHRDTGIRVNYSPGTRPIRDAVGNDALGLSSQSVTNTTGAPNTAPEITSPGSFDVPENQALVRRLAARDDDPGDEVTGWEIVGGADRFQFSVAPDTGELSFRTAPDFEAPGDNEYEVTVEVRSGTGARELEAEQTFTVRVTDEREPPSIPEAPTFSGETAESMTVNWSEPENTGPPITDYDVQYQEGGSGGFTDAQHEGPGFALTLSDLKAGTVYEVQVRARNDEGMSDWSESGEGMTVTPLTVEMTPSPPPPVEGAFSLRFSFSEEVRGFTSGDIETQQEPACTDSANNPISCNPTIAALQTTDDRIFTTTVTPRTAGVNHNYTLTLAAPAGRVTSAAGNKPNEEAMLEVRVAPPGVTVPISSLGRTASPGNGQVTLRWNTPQNTGGSAIIRYEYRWAESGGEFGDWMRVDPSERSATVHNLTNGREYVFEVRGVNALGYGPVETASATPESGGGGGGGGGLPQPPRPPANNRPMADAGPDQTGVREGALVTLDGSGSSDPDDDPLKYRWNQYRGERVVLSSRDVVNPTFTAPRELTADVVLSFRLLVTDPGGRFDTDTVEVTVTVTDENPGKPLAPTVSATTPYSLMVEWMEPENTGPAIIDYDVQYREGDSGDGFTDAQHQGTARTATLTGLMPDTVYEVQVRATNATRTGDWSESGEEKTKTLQTGDQIYYFPHLAVGASWQTTITYINYSPQEVTCQTDFISDHGTPLMVSFAELGTVDSRPDVLPPGGSVHQETDVDLNAPLARGWALANCSGPVKASLLYRQHNSEGMPTAEAGVNATAVPATRFVTFAEQGEGQFGTGVAYANPSATAALVTFTARDTAGEVLASVDRELSPGGHDAHGMMSLFGLTSFTGSIEVTSTEPIVSLSLNFEADPVFSSLPPGELDASAQGSTTYYFPHLAVGASWQTTITYINYSPEEVSCQTDFISDHGTPLMVSFAALGTVVSRPDVLPPGGSVHQETNVDLNASLAPGWARATCSGPVKASLLYRLHNSEGAPTAEAGVNATAVPATRFVTFAEQGEGQFGTGVAYANPSPNISVPVTFTARDAAGEVLARVVRTLLPGGHDAHGMSELFGLPRFTGSIEVTSTEPILSLSLNFEADPVFSSLPPGELDAAAQ